MSNCPLEACALVRSVRAAEPTSTERAVLWHHPKQLEVVSQKRQESLSAFPSAWVLEFRAADLTWNWAAAAGLGGSCFQGKECTGAPRLPAMGEAVLLPSRRTSHLLPLVFMRSICPHLCLFSYVSDLPASLRGRRYAEKPLSVSQKSSVASPSHFSTPDLLLSVEKNNLRGHLAVLLFRKETLKMGGFGLMVAESTKALPEFNAL